MEKLFTTLLLCMYCISQTITAQSIDDVLSKRKMRKDLQVFKSIRKQANSGLYKYRTTQEIDSIYHWADQEIEKSNTYVDFYNIICQLTDFEGSAHNATYIPEKYYQNLKKEVDGYFPYPIKWIEGKWLVNFEDGLLPLGAEIVKINTIPINVIIKNLYKYYTTDGVNVSGKRLGLRTHFSRYFRYYYGQQTSFDVTYRTKDSNQLKTKLVQGVGFKDYYQNFSQRYSKPYDEIYYKDLEPQEKYKYVQKDSITGILTIHSFSIGANEEALEHKKYSKFLDSIFKKIKLTKLKNLIVDIRQNGGGTDPNDLITYSYLTKRTFKENKQAWIKFKKIPMLRYLDHWLPSFLRPLFIGKYNRLLQKSFPKSYNDGFYQDQNSDDHKLRKPNKNAFTGTVYLLVSPAVASAGSLFGAMVSGNENTITIGEETMGGYYGHNGHIPITYVLPKSKIEIVFSIVNLEQDVPKKNNQLYERGIIPDQTVHQTYNDFINQIDTQMRYTFQLIKRNSQ